MDDANHGHKESISTLVDWATKHGAKLHPSAEVFHDIQTGLSLRVRPSASTPISPWEPIVTLPTDLTLSCLNAWSDSGPQAFPPDFLAKTPPHVIGRFYLARQYMLGKDSFWWPYIQALPQPSTGGDGGQEWSLPPFWPDEDAELLDGTNVEVGVGKIRDDIKKEYGAASRLLRQCGGEGLEVSKALYQWAYSIFSSRSFRPSLVLSGKYADKLPEGVTMNDFSVLLPLYDIGNHDMTVEVQWQLQEHGQGDGELGGASACELKIGRTHRAGDQIFNNYSVKTNAELLLGYGFMIPPSDTLHNDYIHVRKRASEPAASDEYLISLRPLTDPSSLVGRAKEAGRLEHDTPLLGAFRHVQTDMAWDIFCTIATPDQLTHLIPEAEVDAGERGNGPNDKEAGEIEAQRRAFFLAGRVGADYRPLLEQTIAVIQHKVLQELERLDETDVEVAPEDAADLTRNQRLALEYRKRCREVLENTLQAIETDI